MQQAFSTKTAPALFNALPAIEKLHKEWSDRMEKESYVSFREALATGLAKIDEYYQTMAESDAHIIAMGMSLLNYH